MIYDTTGREGIDHFELMMVRQSGETDVFGFGYQPRTEDIADISERAKRGYALCVQKVGEVYEVYDLKTLKRQKYSQVWTIGLPVATHTDMDAAIMAAVLLV